MLYIMCILLQEKERKKRQHSYYRMNSRSKDFDQVSVRSQQRDDEGWYQKSWKKKKLNRLEIMFWR